MAKTVLHVGCGRDPLPAWMGGCDETRLDIDPGVQPDIVAPITSLGDIGPFDAVLAQHVLEHVFPHQVGQALNEFRRVLKPGGIAVVTVPNLDGIKPTEDVLYDSPSGPICGLDLFYGSSRFTIHNPFMAHKCGFIRQTLAEALERAGFERVQAEALNGHNLLALGFA